MPCQVPLWLRIVLILINSVHCMYMYGRSMSGLFGLFGVRVLIVSSLGMAETRVRGTALRGTQTNIKLYIYENCLVLSLDSTRS